MGANRMYEGPARAAEEITVITVPYVLDLISVDGSQASVPAHGATYDIEILPGAHEVSVRYYDPHAEEVPGTDDVYRTEPFILVFNTDAGARYVMRYETAMQNPDLSSTGLKVWVEDAATGERRGEERTPGVTSKTDTVHVAEAELDASAASAEDQLKSWWKRATADERERFLDWTAEGR